MNNDEMYVEHILDLYKNPLNFGTLEKFTHEKKKHNPLCGDTFQVRVLVKGGFVKDVKYTGEGCAISVASASIVSDEIIGMSVPFVLKIDKEKVLELLEIPISSARLKCALLFLQAVQEALQE